MVIFNIKQCWSQPFQIFSVRTNKQLDNHDFCIHPKNHSQEVTKHIIKDRGLKNQFASDVYHQNLNRKFNLNE